MENIGTIIFVIFIVLFLLLSFVTVQQGTIIVLTVFVISAAITGTLVVGKPIMLYVGGHKTEAIRFFGYTIGWLLAILVVIIAIRPWQ